jgi:hypothetical protein
LHDERGALLKNIPFSNSVARVRNETKSHDTAVVVVDCDPPDSHTLRTLFMMISCSMLLVKISVREVQVYINMFSFKKWVGREFSFHFLSVRFSLTLFFAQSQRESDTKRKEEGKHDFEQFSLNFESLKNHSHLHVYFQLCFEIRRDRSTRINKQNVLNFLQNKNFKLLRFQHNSLNLNTHILLLF